MKKKFLLTLVVVIYLVCCVLNLTACGIVKSTTDHIHTYSFWISDGELTHTRECSCGDTQTQPHTFSDNTCTRCGYKKESESDDSPDTETELDSPVLMSQSDKALYLNSESPTYYGVGRNINVITDSYIDVDSVYPKIFNEDELLGLNWHTAFVGDTVSQSITEYSMQSFYNQLNTSFNLGISADATISGFTASAELSFGFSNDIAYKNVASEIFHQTNETYISNRVAIDERGDLEQFQSLVKQSVLDFARDHTPKQFVEKYGTHVVLAANYGAKLELDYYMCSHKEQWDLSTEMKYKEKIEGGVKDLAKGGVSVEGSIKDSMGITDESIITSFSAHTVGGPMINATSESEFLKNCDKWIDAVNEKEIENSRIISVPKNSLAAIWDLFPSEYEEEKKKLQEYFDAESKKCSNEFLAQYERSYIPPVEEVDEGDTEHFAGGHGTEDFPYLVSTVAHLENVKSYDDEEVYFRLVNDIDLSEAFFSPIDTFNGILDGDGHEILNFHMYERGSSERIWGLIRTNKGVICNLRLNGTENDEKFYDDNTAMQQTYQIYVSYYNSVDIVNIGGLVGINEGTVANCGASKIKVGGANEHWVGTKATLLLEVGGLVGFNKESGCVEYCYVENSKVEGYSNINGTDGGAVANVGGVVGYNDGKVTNCFTHNNTIFSRTRGGKLWTTTRANLYSRSGGIIGHSNAGEVKNLFGYNDVLTTSCINAEGAADQNYYRAEGTCVAVSSNVASALYKLNDENKNQVGEGNGSGLRSIDKVDDIVKCSGFENGNIFVIKNDNICMADNYRWRNI